jgi:hypothetical protein
VEAARAAVEPLPVAELGVAGVAAVADVKADGVVFGGGWVAVAALTTTGTFFATAETFFGWADWGAGAGDSGRGGASRSSSRAEETALSSGLVRPTDLVFRERRLIRGFAVAWSKLNSAGSIPGVGLGAGIGFSGMTYLRYTARQRIPSHKPSLDKDFHENLLQFFV